MSEKGSAKLGGDAKHPTSKGGADAAKKKSFGSRTEYADEGVKANPDKGR
jgi:hypothetical protein